MWGCLPQPPSRSGLGTPEALCVTLPGSASHRVGSEPPLALLWGWCHHELLPAAWWLILDTQSGPSCFCHAQRSLRPCFAMSPCRGPQGQLVAMGFLLPPRARSLFPSTRRVVAELLPKIRVDPRHSQGKSEFTCYQSDSNPCCSWPISLRFCSLDHP